MPQVIEEVEGKKLRNGNSDIIKKLLTEEQGIPEVTNTFGGGSVELFTQYQRIPGMVSDLGRGSVSVTSSE